VLLGGHNKYHYVLQYNWMDRIKYQAKISKFYGKLNFCYKNAIITDDAVNEIINLMVYILKYLEITHTLVFMIHDWKNDVPIGTNKPI
jgi:hypothetical protein